MAKFDHVYKTSNFIGTTNAIIYKNINFILATNAIKSTLI